MKYDILSILKEQKDMKLKGNIYHQVQTKYAYNTNRIEGSTLTEEQTIHIFETNTLINNGEFTKVDDITDANNHFRLFDYMLDTMDANLNEDLIKKFHKILKRGTTDEQKDWFNVGDYKKLDNVVGSMETSKPKDVPVDIENLLKWYQTLSVVTIDDIIKFHADFEQIHPFQDGNGRVGRMIMFRECLKNNITPFIVDDKHKEFYYRGLVKYRENDKGWLLDTIGSSQDDFIKLCDKFLNNMN